MEKLWHEFQLLPYPSDMVGKEIEGINPSEVDKLATGCIRSYLKDGKSLDTNTKAILKQCMTDLRRLNPKLGGNAQVYFGKLYRLCDLVYAQL